LWFFSHGAAMGFGDVKLALGMGYFLGIWGGLQAVVGAFIIGGVLCAPLLFFSSSYAGRLRRFLTHRYHVILPKLSVTMKSEVPFGPFLVLSTWCSWVSVLYGIPLPWLVV
jgi:prepilin signal peptidase PulO-like enzyme (type II secretory pathway)